MKFLQSILLASVATASTFEECSESSPSCSSSDSACVKREVIHVHNTYDPDYMNALAIDPDLIPDKTVYRCVTDSQKNDLLRISGVEDEKTTVQALYTHIKDKSDTDGAEDESDGEDSTMLIIIIAAAVVLVLCIISCIFMSKKRKQ